jgi:hypothetical protein
MLNGKYISIKTIIEGVYRDYGFSNDLDWVDALEWAGEVLDLISAPKQYISKVTDGNSELQHPCPIKIENYRGCLPEDLSSIISVREYTEQIEMLPSADTFFLDRRVPQTTLDTNTDFTSPLKVDQNLYCGDKIQYKIQNNHIFTSFKEGEVEISYRALPVDCDGLPLIPDNIKYINAVKHYIAAKIAFRMFIQDKINGQKLQKIEQERDWYIGAATTAGVNPTLDEMESWKNQWLRLIPSINQHSNSFRYHSEPSKQINHNSR